MKKITAIALVIMIMISSFPLQVFSLSSQLLQNDNAANAILLEQLKSYFGDDAKGYLDALDELGFLDEDGNLKPNELIVVDGVEMTLEEVETMINDPETDLTKVVTVDDYPVTLNDLRLMIEIEKEVGRIYSTYYTEQDWTDEQVAMLNDLNDAAENGSLSLPESYSLNGTDEPIVLDSFAYEEYNDLGVQKHTGTLTIDNISAFFTYGSTGQAQVTLKVTNAVPNSKVTGKLRTVDGTATDGIDYYVEADDFTIDINDTGTGSMTINVEVKALNLSNIDSGRSFLLQAYDIVGVTNSRESAVINLKNENSYTSTPEEMYTEYMGNKNTSDTNRFITESNYKDGDDYRKLELEDVAKDLINIGVFSDIQIVPHIANMSGHDPNFITGGDYKVQFKSSQAETNTVYKHFSSGSTYGAVNFFRYEWANDDDDLFNVRSAYGVQMDVDLIPTGSEYGTTKVEIERGYGGGKGRSTDVVLDWIEGILEGNVTGAKNADSLDKIYFPYNNKQDGHADDTEFDVLGIKGINTNNNYYNLQWDGELSGGNIQDAMDANHADMMTEFYDTNGNNIELGNPFVSGTSIRETEITTAAFNKIKDNVNFSAPYMVTLSDAELKAMATNNNPLLIKVEPRLIENRMVWADIGINGRSHANIYITEPDAGVWAYPSGASDDTYVEVKLVDNKQPKLTNIEVMRISDSPSPAPDEFYQAGDLVPVKFSFSEPVAFSTSAKVELSGATGTITHTGMTLGYSDYKSEHVFYFEMTENSPGYYTGFSFNNKDYITDLSGNTLDEYYYMVKVDPVDGNQNNNTNQVAYVSQDVIASAITDISAEHEIVPSVNAGEAPYDAININLTVSKASQTTIASGAEAGVLPDYDENLYYSVVIKSKVTYKDVNGDIVSKERNLHFTEVDLASDFLGHKLSATIPVADIHATDREVLVEIVKVGSTPADDRILTGDGNFSAITLVSHVYIDKDDMTLTTPSFMEENSDGVYVFEYGEISGQNAEDPHFTIDLADVDPFYTFPESFEVSSSNDDVISAQVVADDSQGNNKTSTKVELIVGAAGEASITVVAANGGYTTGEAVVENYTKEIKFEIIAGTDPFLGLQIGQDEIDSYIGAPFAINFLSNLCENTKEGAPTSFFLEIKDDTDKIVHEQTLTYKYGDRDIFTNFVVPAAALTSTGDYTAKITTDFSGISTELEYDITILANPVVATLTRPENRYITDATYSDGKINIPWNLENWDSNSDGAASFSLTVTDENGVETSHYTGVPTENSGAIALNIPKVIPTENDYRDIYTINIKAKNSTDINTSQDSFILYVYPDDLVKLYVNHEKAVPTGADAGAKIGPDDEIDLMLSNRDRIDAMDQDAILMLERNIQLEAYLSTNYTEYSYGQASDQFRWDVAQTDEEKAEVAALYKYQNSAYYDLRSLVNGAYMAQEPMLLAGLSTGEATVTATHDNTGDSASVNLTVETLEDHLYLIDVYPDVETEYYYIDADNKRVDGKSNAEGKIAIYDEKGVPQEIYLESTYNGDKYLGTIFNDDLVSGEQNSAFNVLYPEVLIELRKAAYADIYLKNADGTNFVGDITMRAGVYVDGVYQEAAEFSFDGGNSFAKGNDDLNVNIASSADGGLISITMDVTQFSEKITNENEIDYIFELYPEGKYPIIVYEDPTINVDEVEAVGQFVYYLKDAAKKEAFIGYSTAGYNNNNLQIELDKDVNYIGPNEKYPTVHLNTSIYWWGYGYNNSNLGATATMTVLDDNGLELKNQDVVTEKHEFSDMWRTVNITPLDKEQMDYMSLLPKDSRGLMTNIYMNSEEVHKTIVYDQNIINLLGLQTVDEDEDLLPNLDTISDLRVDGDIDDEIINNDKIFIEGFSAITKLLSFGMGEPVEILFEPTADPLVYTGLISKNANQSDVGYGDEGSEHTVSFNFFDKTQNRSKTKQSLSDKRKMANGTYTDKLNKDIDGIKDLAAGGTASGGRVIFVPPSLGGYIEAEFRYDPQADNWDMELVSGGLSADTIFGYRYSWNTLLGGVVPFTSTLELGATLGIAADFQSGEHYARNQIIQTGPNTDEYILPEPEKGIDILTELRIGFYFEIFGGLGFDASVIAAKIGIFGRMDVILGFRWLNRPYLGDDTFKDNYFIPEVIDTSSDNPSDYRDVAYDEVLSAGDVEFKGRVGLRAELKFLFFEKTYEFFSVEFAGFNTTWGQWNAISDIWLRNDRVNGNPVNQVTIGGAELFTLDYGNTVETRNYLDAERRSYDAQADASWEDRSYIDEGRSYSPYGVESYALDEGDDSKFPTETWTNIYPHSTPMISDDGKVMVYLDDMLSKNVEDTRVNYSILDGVSNKYSQGSVIPGVMADDGTGTMVEEESYGDVQLSIDGDMNNLVAAYVRQSDEMLKDEGVALSDAEVMQMMNLTEIYVSHFNGTDWTTTRVTNNASADLAPVVATNGSKTIVAWREVAATDYSDPTNFDSKDRVMYSISGDDGVTWSEAKVLYDGSKGGIMSISADMLEDGTAAVVYSYDETIDGGAHDMEIAAAIIENSANADEFTGNNSVKIINLTEDESLNENVQLTTADINGEENFIIGWFNQSIEMKQVENEAGIIEDVAYEVPEVKFMAIDAVGSINPTIPETLSSITANSGVEVGRDFIFSQNSDDITDLSLAWVDVSESGNVVADADGNTTSMTASTYTINSAKFVKLNETLGLSAVSEIAQMPEDVVPAHFDLYKTATNGDNYNAIILGTDYATDIFDTRSVTLDTTNESGEPVSEGLEVPSMVTITDMYSATLSFENSVKNEEVFVEFEQVAPNTNIDLVFTVTNAGKEILNDVTIKIGAQEVANQTGLNLLPGQTTKVIGRYIVPNKIEDVDYTTTATFASGNTASDTATMYLDYPDVGISNFEMVQEQNGVRKIAVGLYNATNIPLEGSGKTVKLALYSSPEHTEESRIDDVAEIIITDANELALIDAGGYTNLIEIDLDTLLKSVNTDENGNLRPEEERLTEIPTGGIEVYAKVWVEVGVGADAYEQAELYIADNYNSATILSLLEKNGNAPVTISKELTHTSGTTAEVSVLNNSLNNVETGNLLAQLVDADGNVIETMQSYSKGEANNGLITLNGEEEAIRTFNFTQTGADVLISYGEAIDVKSAELSSITLQGIPLDIYDFNEGNNARIVVQNIANTTPALSIMAKSPTANISVSAGSGADSDKNSNIYAGNADLTTAINEIVFTVTDGNEEITYTVDVIDLSKLATPVIRPAVTENGVTTVEIVVAPSTKDNELVALVPDDIMDSAVLNVIAEASRLNTSPKIKVTVAEQRKDVGSEVEINPQTLEKLADVNGAMLEIQTNVGSMTFDQKAIQSMIEQAKGEMITIIIRPAENLTNKQITSINGNVAYDILVMAGNKIIDNFANGIITVAVNYALKVNEKADNVKIYRVATDGTLTAKETTYNPKTARASFTTSTLSVYMVDVQEGSSDGGSDIPMTGENSMLGLYVLLFTVSLTSIVAINRKILYRKK